MITVYHVLIVESFRNYYQYYYYFYYYYYILSLLFYICSFVHIHHISSGLLRAKVFCLSPMLPNAVCQIDKHPISNNLCWLSDSQPDNYVI